jgi:chromate transporter
MLPNVPNALDVFVRFLRLGFTSFGGPVAHIGYFRREFVERARWLDDTAYGEIVALCSVLPGPTSSQVGIALGARRAGPLGGLLAWVAFSSPSALAMGALGCAAHLTRIDATGPLQGLAAVAAAVVLAAVIAMARSLLRAPYAYVAALLAFGATFVVDARAPSLTWAVLAASGMVAAFFAPPTALPAGSALPHLPRAAAVTAAIALVTCLVALPALAARNEYLALFTTFFRAGSLVFGGGHVVLPFLETVVASGRVDAAHFAFGYGVAQAVPGPLFTVAAYLGAADVRVPIPALGAFVATFGIFAPSFLLLTLAAPLWGRLRAWPRSARILTGLNAAVVGILAAVFAGPIAGSVAHAPVPIAIAFAAFALLQFARWPSWAVVALGATGGAAASSLLHA